MVILLCSGAELVIYILLFKLCLLMINTEISQKPLRTVSNLVPNYMTLHFFLLIYILNKKFIKKSLQFNISGLDLLFKVININVCQLDHKQMYCFSQMVKKEKKIRIKNNSLYKSYKLSILYIYF